MSFNVTFTRTTFSERVPYPNTTRDSHELVAEWTNLITLTSKDRLTVGALFNRTAGTESDVAIPLDPISARGSEPGGAFYGQIDHQLLRDVKLIAGFQTIKIGSIPLNGPQSRSDLDPRAMGQHQGTLWSGISRARVGRTPVESAGNRGQPQSET
jgi:hypothetical protein